MRKLFPIYPILLGIIWVLITYSANKESLTSVSVVVIPILVVTGILAAIWGITWLIVRDWKKSALVVAVIFCITIAHGYVRDYTNVAGMAAAPIWAGMMVAGVYAVTKLTRPKGRVHITIIGNVVCVAVLAVSLFSAFSGTSAAEVEPNSNPVPINSQWVPSPDVYYIIPDTYTSNLILGTHLGYNNSEFTDFLVSRGFYVDEDAFANYHHSVLSISSVMNMKYWTDEELGESAGRSLGRYLIQNPVGDTFKEAGYTYIHIGSWWCFTATNAAADIVPQFSSLAELDFTLYRMTLWYDLLDFFFDAGGNGILREAHLNQFETLKKVSEMEESTFTFCHLILPHPPFLFDADGRPTSGWILPPEEWERMYLDQLTYTNKLLMETIDTILANTDGHPVIILAADEGYSGPAWQEYWEQAQGLQTAMEDRPDLVTERQGTLFAIYNFYDLWGEETPSSPVNTFRCVFNSLFNSNLEYLPDRYFLKSIGKYEHEFVEITEFING